MRFRHFFYIQNMQQILIFISLFLLFSQAFAVLEIPNAQPKVGATQWKQVLDSTWQGIKKRNIDAYTTGLVHRPKSETPGDAVSEGVGYGMLLALFANDQSYFDKIYKAGKNYRLNFCQDWHQPANGGKGMNDGGSATDADEDIALALIFADKLVKKGLWNSSDVNYATDAQNGVNCVWGSMNNGLLWPGNNWQPGYNVGYFAPAWYKIFNNFDSQRRNWTNAVNRSYEFIRANASYDIGMVPDWNQENGTPGLGGNAGYNGYMGGRTFFKDAIRVLWRIANDYIWFGESRAKEFLDNSLKFIKNKGGPDAANFYQLEGSNKGELLPFDDKWTQFNGENNSSTWRYRREHSHLTVGQWLIVPLAVGSDDDKKDWSKKMAEFYDWENKVNFFGNAIDPTGGVEDTLHNEMYFDQFLAWFGVSLMSGTWVNVIALLDNPVQNTEGITEQPFDKPKDPEPPEPIIAKTRARLDLQISQSMGSLHLHSKSDVVWKIHSLQGKLLFSSNLRETAWNTGNLMGTVIVSATSGSNVEKKLLVVR
jgi:endo-1,4-beta-D-glucanase Y